MAAVQGKESWRAGLAAASRAAAEEHAHVQGQHRRRREAAGDARRGHRAGMRGRRRRAEQVAAQRGRGALRASTNEGCRGGIRFGWRRSNEPRPASSQYNLTLI